MIRCHTTLRTENSLFSLSKWITSYFLKQADWSPLYWQQIHVFSTLSRIISHNVSVCRCPSPLCLPLTCFPVLWTSVHLHELSSPLSLFWVLPPTLVTFYPQSSILIDDWEIPSDQVLISNINNNDLNKYPWIDSYLKTLNSGNWTCEKGRVR